MIYKLSRTNICSCLLFSGDGEERYEILKFDACPMDRQVESLCLSEVERKRGANSTISEQASVRVTR